MVSDIEFKRDVLEVIFDYHGLDMKNENLKKIWNEDMATYSADEVRRAWDYWRMQPDNHRRKPSSGALRAVLKSWVKAKAATVFYEPVEQRNLPPRGTGYLVDRLRDNLQKMHRANPRLVDDLKTEPTLYGKLMLCAIALNHVELLESEAAHGFLQGMEKRAV